MRVVQLKRLEIINTQLATPTETVNEPFKILQVQLSLTIQSEYRSHRRSINWGSPK